MPTTKKIVGPLQQLLMETSFESLVNFCHRLKASWGISRPQKMNDRKQSAPYRARIQLTGGLEYASSGDTAKAALSDAIAKFLVDEHRDFHSVMESGK